MVVSRSDVRDQRTERVERCIMAFFDLTFHILFYFVHGHVSRTFDECLHILFPSTYNEFSHGVEFGKLCFIVGIVDRAGT